MYCYFGVGSLSIELHHKNIVSDEVVVDEDVRSFSALDVVGANKDTRGKSRFATLLGRNQVVRFWAMSCVSTPHDDEKTC